MKDFTIDEYVKRLKKMLSFKELDCEWHCPASKWFGLGNARVNDHNCRICQEFVGLNFVPFRMPKVQSCPCYRLEEGKYKDPFLRAQLAIEAYEAKHEVTL